LQSPVLRALNAVLHHAGLALRLECLHVMACIVVCDLSCFLLPHFTLVLPHLTPSDHRGLLPHLPSVLPQLFPNYRAIHSPVCQDCP
jgi:hypothetical protein